MQNVFGAKKNNNPSDSDSTSNFDDEDGYINRDYKNTALFSFQINWLNEFMKSSKPEEIKEIVNEFLYSYETFNERTIKLASGEQRFAFTVPAFFSPLRDDKNFFEMAVSNHLLTTLLSKGYLADVLSLLNKTQTQYLFYYCCANGRFSIAELLLQNRDIEVNLPMTPDCRRQPILVTVVTRIFDESLSPEEINLKMAEGVKFFKLLIDRGADVDARYNNVSLIEFIYRYNRLDLATVLFSYSAERSKRASDFTSLKRKFKLDDSITQENCSVNKKCIVI